MKEIERIEILPHPNDPNGFVAFFSFDKRKNLKEKEEVDEIRKMVMADLLERKYLPKPTEVEWRDSGYYFLIVVKETRPELLEDLKQALNRVLKGR